MVDEQHINGTYFKRYSATNNEHLLFILPARTLGPRAFWDFKLPNGKTHSEYFFEAGIDVILFDPVGFGNSTDFYNYDRTEYGNQILKVTETIKKTYKNKAILGFCNSTSPALITAQYGFFNKLIIHSPSINLPSKDKTVDCLKNAKIVEVSMPKFKSDYLDIVSDVIIPKTNRVSNWEDSVMDVVKTYTHYSDGMWKCPGKVVNDPINYPILNSGCGFDIKKIKTEVLAIMGQYDFQMYQPTTNFPWFFRTFKPKVVNIPDSTHFSMWENNSHITRNAIIDFLTK